MFGIEIREEGKHMITGMKDQKTIINITTIKQRFFLTHAYKLAKFLVPLLCPFPTNSYTISDTFMFVKELCELQINTNNVVMASFDVKSLFTNIPLDETIHGGQKRQQIRPCTNNFLSLVWNITKLPHKIELDIPKNRIVFVFRYCFDC